MAFWNDPSSIVPKRQYAWVVYFGSKSLNGISVNDNKLFVGFVKQIAKPTYQVKTTQHKYLGLHEFHYPTHVTWQPIKITLADAYIYDSSGQYLRADEILWENGKIKPKDFKLTKRSAQSFFYDALREGGYSDPEEYDAENKLARFRRTVFKNDLVGSIVGMTHDYIQDINNNLVNENTRKWNTLDIIEYSSLNIASNLFADSKESDSFGESQLTRYRTDTEKYVKERLEKDFKEAINAEDSGVDLRNNYKDKSNALINANNTNTKEMERWELYNPIVTDVSFGELNYEQDGIANITITIAYDWAKLTVNGDPADTDEEVKNSLTKPIDTKIGIARVLADNIDSEVARQVARARGVKVPTIVDFQREQIQQKVKEANIYATDTNKVDILNPDDQLTDAFSTSESQLLSEIDDIDSVQKNTQEARRATADALLAASLSNNKEVIAEIDKRTDLSSEERELLKSRLAYAPSLGIEQMQIIDDKFEQENEKLKNEYIAAEIKARELAKTEEFGIGANERLKKQATTGDEIDTLSEKIGASQSFDEQRNKFINDRIFEQIRTSPITTLDYKNADELIDQLKKTYGEIDEQAVRTQLGEKAESIYSQNIFALRKRQDKLKYE
jgi:hypothetical protein